MTGLAAGLDRTLAVIGLDPHRFSQAQPERAERLAFWLLGVAQTVGYGAFFYIFAALLLAWEPALPYGKSWLAFAFMCATLMAALVSPFAGRMIDAARGRWLLTGGLTIGTLSLLLLAGSQSYPVFFLAWLGLGVAEGLCLRGFGMTGTQGALLVTLHRPWTNDSESCQSRSSWTLSARWYPLVADGGRCLQGETSHSDNMR